MTKFSWTCPYCNRGATITESNFSRDTHTFEKGNKHGTLEIITTVITCPNDECREYVIEGKLHKLLPNVYTTKLIKDKLLMKWSMRPKSFAKQFPDYVPKAIINDYEEACLIRDLSPKASATLSRRCLQGIIRDFWKIKKGRLIDEINELQNKIDPTTWKAIDSVRSIGNIGAHMEKDINLIIDVEPKEAQLLIDLIEMLIKDWYISQHEREQRLQAINDVAAQKSKEKKSNKSGQQDAGESD